MIRIKDGREKAIDILAKNLTLFRSKDAADASIHQDLDVELTEPSQIFVNMSLQYVK